MGNFTKNIAPYVQRELQNAEVVSPIAAFMHLESAHVLGQESTYWHVIVHYRMFMWGIQQRDLREVTGQAIRLLGAALLTAIKAVPTGNTGGANVSMVRPMPIGQEHADIIRKAKL